MKVVFISSWWPTSIHPTNGNFVYKHARTVAQNHELVVVHVQHDRDLSGKRFAIIHRKTKHFVEIIVSYGWGRGAPKPLNFLLRILAYCRGLKRVVDTFGRPDLIHAHVMLDAGIAAYCFAWLSNLPFLISEHSTLYIERNNLPFVQRMLTRWVGQRAGAILPVSAYLAERMQRTHGIKGRFQVLSNVVNDQVFYPGEEKVSGRTFRLLHVSTLRDEQKNFTGLLSAFAKVNRSYPGEFSLDIISEGELETAIRYSERMGIGEDAVFFTGTSSEAAIAARMRQSDALVLYSHFETQGVVVLEALCCGLPCIVSDIRPLKDMVLHRKDGLVVKAGSPKSLASAIVEAKKTSASYDRLAISERARKKYSEKIIGKVLDKIYRSTVCR